MARRRLAVVILAPPSEAHDVDVLRRAVGVPEPFHVAPHCTLVPPLNVRDEDVPTVLGHLRSVATRAVPFHLDVGPATTFAPETPTLHLAVGGSGEAALRAVRSAVRSGPLDRDDVWPFTPHVTLQEHHPVDRIPTSVETLSGVHQRWAVDRLHLLEQRRRDDGSAHWVPIREEPFGGPVVVGRGGVELALRCVSMIDDEVAALTGSVGHSGAGHRPLVVATELRETGLSDTDPVGPTTAAAVGRIGVDGAAWLDAVVVDEAQRGLGIGRHTLAGWCSAAADRNATVVLSRSTGATGDGFLVGHGFVPVGDVLVRSLSSGAPTALRSDR